jgi:hypothetical protein
VHSLDERIGREEEASPADAHDRGVVADADQDTIGAASVEPAYEPLEPAMLTHVTESAHAAPVTRAST